MSYGQPRGGRTEEAVSLTGVAHGKQLFGGLTFALASGRLRHVHVQLEWRVAIGLNDSMTPCAGSSSFGEVLRVAR